MPGAPGTGTDALPLEATAAPPGLFLRIRSGHFLPLPGAGTRALPFRFANAPDGIDQADVALEHHRRAQVAAGNGVRADGPVDQNTASWPSSRPNTEGLSKRGKHSQTTQPDALTSAAEEQSDSSA